MTDTVTLAQTAKELISNEAFLEALRRMENHLIDTWKTTGPLETDVREALYHQQQAIATMVSTLTDMRDEPGLYKEETLDEPTEGDQ